MSAIDRIMKRQRVLADFGDLALRSDDLDAVLTQACRLVAEALETQRAKVLEIVDDGAALFVRAGVGWDDGIVGNLRLQMSVPSSETYSIETGAPVITNDLALEDRFDFADLLKDAGVRALANVPVFLPGGTAFGLLQVDATEPRAFGDDDVQFLRTYASILGPVIDRLIKVRELRASEARLRALAQASSDLFFVMNPDWTEAQSMSSSDIVGLVGPSRSWLVDYVPPEDHAVVRGAVAAALQTRGVYECEHRLYRSDGSTGWVASRAVPVLGPAGEVQEWFGSASDITERRQADERLRESERRFRTLAEGIPQLVWRAGGSGDWRWASPQWISFTGLSLERSLGWAWLDAVHPEDRTSAIEVWSRATQSGDLHAEYRIRGASSGHYRHFQTRATPVRRDNGVIEEWLGTSTDVDEIRQLQERQGVLVAELQHRTRNLIGVVRSLADRTLAGSVDLDDFRARFRDRLDALARVQGLLSRREHGRRVTFDELIRAELEGLGAIDGTGHGPRVTLEGEQGIRLRSATVQTLALGLHELATNAVKYGALSPSGGRLHITWSATGAPDKHRALHVTWRESGTGGGGHRAAAEQRRGYGRELIEKALPYQLKAQTRYELTPDGVLCTIVLPLPDDEGAVR